ncbi:chromosomal replication initiator protein DnaA [Sphingosinicella rhizophila]|uniref:Chromosomal replication initiator protein DnaA n=1 Tax=Sphingosinicella rhizophila TaxID=3050082 RepID=A0ABU3Q9K6_9SPHN|nr:chromosomal replication initiator protein DnaA [Sphingosinicella sp. GR2756]MDT9599997.1 chromosomal replication initiator protein DnaA [Sphingosinicella sp. GR2756]
MEANAADPIQSAWEMIRSGLRRDCGTRTFDGWLRPIALGDFDPDTATLRLELPSQFMADWVQTHFSERLGLAWRTTLPMVRHILIGVGANAPRTAAVVEIPAPAEADEPSAAKQNGNLYSGALEPRYRFENFVVGKANEVAFNAARTLASAQNVAFNPLFLHGGTGRGKTHLLHAIGHEFHRLNPRGKIVYMSAEKFMVEFVAALRANETIQFKQQLRSADLLMIDDVQFIAGKESTQEEFFHTMNEIISAGRRLVISSDRAPQDLDGIEPRILSRLSWGLVADINQADLELRLNIIIKKLEAFPDVAVPNDVRMFLAKRISSNVRELEGALNRIAAYAMMQSRVIDLDFVTEVLANILRANQRRISIDEIQGRVSDHYRIRKAEMTSARRAREVARPRQVAMYLSKQLTPRSLPEIGRRFGGRDHTTVIHAVRQIEKLRAQDAELDADIRLLTRQLES